MKFNLWRNLLLKPKQFKSWQYKRMQRQRYDDGKDNTRTSKKLTLVNIKLKRQSDWDCKAWQNQIKNIPHLNKRKKKTKKTKKRQSRLSSQKKDHKSVGEVHWPGAYDRRMNSKEANDEGQKRQKKAEVVVTNETLPISPTHTHKHRTKTNTQKKWNDYQNW